MYRRSLGIIEKYFEDIVLKDQDVLGSEENWSKVLNCIQDDEIIKKLSNKWNGSNSKSSVQKWDELVNELEHAASASGRKYSKKAEQLQICEHGEQIINLITLGCRFKKRSLFIGRVCVPIQPDNCENFDPFEVPTVSSLYQELNLYIDSW
ncbi:hypothetical protein C2G38_2199424 [Gigaspora rosea]|uniref:Uncharacterized protein n=1 Tax=Gigaspora rosea TaxID=44941 RepID=A0A397USX3_9GLOM|nr:hypothetical protein C2G38_2199424 [Gigaspora rosea]